MSGMSLMSSMTHVLAGSLSVVIALTSACHASSLAQPPAVAAVTRLFGPVIAAQVIRGREEEGHTVLLLVDHVVVRVDLARRKWSATPIRLEPGETAWGLARLADGSLWSLKGRTAVMRIESDGSISRVIPLEEPHAGLFAFGEQLIFQQAVGSAPDPALRASVPGAATKAAWSEMRVRSIPGIARAQAAALSLVACGRSAVAERPCWFPDEAAVSLIAIDGTTRRIPLSGISPVAPEVLLTAENPRRPVRDAYVDALSRLWVLSSGDAPAGSADVPGGWLLARYKADGTPDGQARLSQAARLILEIESSRVIVLTGTGDVSEVASW